LRPTRIAAPVGLCLVAALALPATAASAARTTGASGRTQRVLLALTPQDRGALRALAHSSVPHGSTRSAALAAALPSESARSAVVSTVRSLGLVVDRVSQMSVLVSGSASRIRNLFGSARAVDPTSPVEHALPTLPAALRSYVTIAFGGDDNRPAARHFALPDRTADGTDFRTAYGVSNLDPLASPTPAEKQETIATVQLSGWHSNDLNKYADFLRQQTGNPNWPTPRYTQVDDPLLPSCIASNSNKCPNAVGDDVEVDLDQEAVYATAPYAHQRAYTSGNDFLGLFDSLTSVGDDASDPRVDRHIVAASVSWGFCETDLDQDPNSNRLYSSFEDVLSYDLATGVTVFGSSGDNGAFCDGKHKGVSYPSSSPQVVAVGGAQYPSSVATDTPQGWVEPGFAASKDGASGGGVSEAIPEPDFQKKAGITASGRVVPDVSALAGSPGFDVVTTSPSGPGTFPVGGTSAATPITASTYAVQVAQHGYSWGVGNILTGLYGQATSFTDVNDGCTTLAAQCAGFNGADVAHAGYDEVTGLGTPKWSTLISPTLGGDPHLTVSTAYSKSTTVPVAVHTADWQSFNRFRIDVDANHTCTIANATATPPTSVKIDDFGYKGLADGIHDLTLVAFNSADNQCHYADAFVFVDTTKPSPIAELSPGSGVENLILHWGGDDAGGSGIKTYRVSVTTGGRQIFSTTAGRGKTVRIPAQRGKAYAMTVTGTDYAGNVQSSTATLVDDAGLSLSGRWSRVFSKSDYAGATSLTSRSGATAARTLTDRVFVVYVVKCASCGKAVVSVDGRRVKTIDTFATHTLHRVAVKIFRGKGDQQRHVVIRTLGSRNSRSTGNDVYIDALTGRG
jgi:hypothetical protein